MLSCIRLTCSRRDFCE